MSDDKLGAAGRPDSDEDATEVLGPDEGDLDEGGPNDGGPDEGDADEGEAGEVTRGMPADLAAVLEQDDATADEGRYDAPPLPPLLILAVVGLLCGFATVALVWLSERGCDRVRDTPSCGALGLPLLALTVIITIVLGALALSRLGMPQPRLVAFLGVMFMLLIVVGLLADRLFSTWTLLVVPVLTAITFLLAHLIAERLERADA